MEKALRDLFMKQKVYPPEECFDALKAVNDFYQERFPLLFFFPAIILAFACFTI